MTPGSAVGWRDVPHAARAPGCPTRGWPIANLGASSGVSPPEAAVAFGRAEQIAVEGYPMPHLIGEPPGTVFAPGVLDLDVRYRIG